MRYREHTVREGTKDQEPFFQGTIHVNPSED